MRRLSPSYVFAAVLLVLLAALALGSVRKVVPQAAAPVTGSVVPVTAATLVCPGLAASSAVSQHTVLSAGSPAPVSAGATGATPTVPDGLRIDRLGSSLNKPPLAAVSVEGTRSVSYAVPPGPARTFVIRATGSLAQGLSAQFLTRTPLGPGRSLAAGQCAAPGGEFWFVGGGANPGRATTLLLTNVDSAPATVDVTAYGAKGPVNAEPGQGLLVAPGKQVALPIDSLIPGEPSTAIHVVARSGRFSASMYDTQATGLTPGGADWVPQSISPATSLVVPAIAGDFGAARTVSLVVPGPSNAVIRIGIATASGLLVPAGYDALEVPAGQLVSLKLSAIANPGPSGLVITSDQPLVAGVRVVRGTKAQLPDFAYAAGSSPVTSPRVLTAVATNQSTLATLQLTAGAGGDARVLVTIIPVVGAPVASVVTVPANRTVVVQLGPGLTAAAPGTVELAPMSGTASVYAGVTVKELGARGPLMTTRWFGATPVSVRLPTVQPDPGLATTTGG